MDKNSDDVGTGLVGAPACGDVMKLQVIVILWLIITLLSVQDLSLHVQCLLKKSSTF